jgi:hypothetical protein
LFFFFSLWLNFGNGDFLFIGEKSIKMILIMRNKPNFQKSQIFITLISTTNYNEKFNLDTWSKRTQTKPILSAAQADKIALSAAEGPIKTNIQRGIHYRSVFCNSFYTSQIRKLSGNFLDSGPSI